MPNAAFLPREIVWATTLTLGVESALLATMILAGANNAKLRSQEEAPILTRSIQVKPVLDDLPLLKLGDKRVKAKLPDMWVKHAPVPRVEEKSAPSPKASKAPEAATTAPLVKRDAGPPPPDADVAKKVDQPLSDAGPTPAPSVSGEGAPDGVKEGTEADPLKARALSLYKMKILGWFNARFVAPAGQIPCDVLHGLSSAVQVSVGGDRVIASYTVVRASNNPVFDAKVKATLDAMVGQELPPPPPLFPDLTPGTLIRPTLSGKEAKCE